ncbi:MAG: PriCT-2 domain-containing protein [Devosia sp.]
MTEPLDHLKVYGAHLIELGYPIVPIKPGTKYPQGLPRWQDTAATVESLSRWSANGFAGGGVGILTKNYPAVDIDIMDHELVGQMIDWCTRNIGPAPQRVGMAPKVLLPYRTDAPFTKIASRTYQDELGFQNRIEVLGDGQQYVAYAQHPDTGNPYQWVDDKGLAATPSEELTTITADQARALVAFFEENVPTEWTPINDGVDGGERTIPPSGDGALANAKAPLALSDDQVDEALKAVANKDLPYDQWVAVGMALHHQFDGADTGFQLWDEWSATSTKYHAGETAKRWRSFAADLTRTKPTTFATVLKWAADAGVHIGGSPAPEGSVLQRFLTRYVFVEQGNLVCDLDKPPNCATSRIEEFRNATANVRHPVRVPTRKGPPIPKLVPVHQSWLVHPDRKTAQGVLYEPDQPAHFERDGLWWINAFHLPVFAPSDASTAVFHEHMAYLFPIPEEREWFVDWMAFNLQRPATRCKVTPLHVARAHGTGRGWVVELMQKLLGAWNCTKTKMSVLCGDGPGGAFHDYLHRTLFCAIEEVREGTQRYSVSDRIRDVLTEGTLEVNLKYGAKRTQSVHTNFFFMTNHPDALVLTTRDRRVNVFSGPDAPQDSAYYDRLYGWAKGPGVAALHKELLGRDLSAFEWRRSMETPGREAMIANNQTETEVLFHEFIAAPPHPAMTFRQVVATLVAMSGDGPMGVDVDERQVTKLLQHHAVQGPRLRVEGKKVRPWVLDEVLLSDPKQQRESILAGPADR